MAWLFLRFLKHTVWYGAWVWQVCRPDRWIRQKLSQKCVLTGTVIGHGDLQAGVATHPGKYPSDPAERNAHPDGQGVCGETKSGVGRMKHTGGRGHVGEILETTNSSTQIREPNDLVVHNAFNIDVTKESVKLYHTR